MPIRDEIHGCLADLLLLLLLLLWAVVVGKGVSVRMTLVGSWITKGRQVTEVPLRDWNSDQC